MHNILQDIRYALRTMRKAPGFAAIAIATLALGIGGTAIMFAVVDAVLIRPLPYPHSEQIVHLSEAFDRSPGMSLAYANFLDWQRMNHVFSSMGAVQPQSVTLTGAGGAEQIEGWSVSSDFFRVLGVQPALGRDFTADDDKPSAAATVLLSHNLWQRRFNSDPAVVGRSVAIDGAQYTVIGVLPKGFSYNDQMPDAYKPIGLIQDRDFRQNRYAHAGTYAIARMKPGVMLEQARTDMDRVAFTLQQQYPETNKHNTAFLIPMREYMVGSVRTPLMILLVAVALLLLIACGNVANLLLAKASGRTHEMAIRQAIGATRVRLLGQLLTESLVLALMGGVVGALLALWGTQALVAAAPDSLPRLAEIHMDARVLAFTFAIAVLTGIVFGIFPALQAPKAGARLALQSSLRGGTSRGQQRVRDALITGEIALSLALLLGAGLLLRSFQRVMEVNAGFNTHQLLTATVVMSENKYKTVAQAEQFYDEFMRNIRQIPGVTAAAGVVPLPMSGNEWDTDYVLEGMNLSAMQRYPNTEIGYAGTGYVEAMQIPVVAGRVFTEADNEQSLPVAIVNQEFARKNWPNENPIGKRIRLGAGKELIGPETAQSRWHTIVGVIGNVKQYGLDRRTVATVYRPFAQIGRPMLRRDLVIRTAMRDPLMVTEAVRKAVAAADPEQAVADFYTMDHRLTGRLATRQISMVLLGIFAALALSLGAIGIYGVVAYWVAQRTREIGVRIALGATAGQVLQLVLGRAAALLGIGLAIGLAAFLALAHFLQTMLFGVGTGDALVYAAVILVLSAATALASYVPARRAARIDPMTALRYE